MLKPFISIFEVEQKEEIEEFYLSDCERIVRVCEEHGYEISIKKAYKLWGQYSEDFYCAGWLYLPEEDEQLWKTLKRVNAEENEDVESNIEF